MMSVTPAMMIAPTVRGGKPSIGTATSSEAAPGAAFASSDERDAPSGSSAPGSALEGGSLLSVSPRASGSFAVSRKDGRAEAGSSASCEGPSVAENEY